MDTRVTTSPLRRSAGRQSAFQLSAAAAALFSLAVGCAKPGPRISVAELQELEQAPPQATPAGVAPGDLALPQQRSVALAPGDVLAVTLTGLNGLSLPTVVRARVQADGALTLPLVGGVPVGGLSLAAAEQRVQEAYVPQYFKDLAVFLEVSDLGDTPVIVAGAAAAAGIVNLPHNECNVVYAVARASGFGTGASGRVRVVPIAPGSQENVYDLTSIADLRRALLAPPLRSGDLVFVEAADTSAIYLSGLVNVPGPIPLPPHGRTSLVRAIASAGGVRDMLAPTDATLWRKLPDGRNVRVQLDLGEILAGRSDDIELAAGDVVEIPHTLDTRVRDWMVQNLRLGPFNMGVAYDPLAQYNFNRALAVESGSGDFAGTVTDSVLFGLNNAATGGTAKPTRP